MSTKRVAEEGIASTGLARLGSYAGCGIGRLKRNVEGFFFSSRRPHTSSKRDWSSDVCSSDLLAWRFSRSGGPGGQSVNTSDSRVELLFDLVGSPSVPKFLKARALPRLESRLVDGVLAIAASDRKSVV